MSCGYPSSRWEPVRRSTSCEPTLKSPADSNPVPSPPGPQTRICVAFLAGFLQQLEVEGSDIVNNRIAIDYILELTSGVTGRIVELLRLSARCAMRRDSHAVNVDLLQEAGKEFASDLGSERNVSH
jgi:hypothetical protein